MPASVYGQVPFADAKYDGRRGHAQGGEMLMGAGKSMAAAKKGKKRA
jgi:hypothetical protein